MFQNSALYSKLNQRVCIAKSNMSVVFKAMIASYFVSHTKPINTICGQNAVLLFVKAGNTMHVSYAGLSKD